MSNSIPGAPPPIDFNVLLAEFDTSGLSAAAFARSRGFPSWRIYVRVRPSHLVDTPVGMHAGVDEQFNFFASAPD